MRFPRRLLSKRHGSEIWRLLWSQLDHKFRDHGIEELAMLRGICFGTFRNLEVRYDCICFGVAIGIWEHGKKRCMEQE